MIKNNLELFFDGLKICSIRNYDKIQDIFNHEYGYPEFDPLRDEICKCIICDLHQAAITLTNHLLESALKKCLVIKFTQTNEHDWNSLEEAFKKGISKFDKLNLDKTIDHAFDYGLISINQKDILRKFKKEFRNPYSHAETEGIFKDTFVNGKILSFNKIDSFDSFLESAFDTRTDKLLDVRYLLPMQGLIQVFVAEKNSISYFSEVDKIIRDMITQIRSSH